MHPGYGFLSENAAFAKACADAGIAFVGPKPAALELFGDKVAARQLAKRCGVPIIAGTSGPSSLDEITAFFTSLGSNAAIVIKAMAGGGGRGMRVVENAADLAEAYARCQSEAKAAFGFDGVYAERLIRQARHIEVQIIGDRHGAISHLWERECTIQRRHQKLIEVAPSPSLSDGLRGRIIEAAKQLATAASYDNLGTFEFLVDGTAEDSFAFIEANPRLQVEHTVTEEVLGLDLVRAQLAIAAGSTLASLGLAQGSIPKPRGYAMQLRVNMETLDETGATHPTGGVLAVFEPPSGPGVRVDSFGYAGYKTSAAFDSLLAKVIVHTPGEAWHDVVAKASRALREFRIDGVVTNIAFLQAVLAHPDFRTNRIATDFIDRNIAKLVEAADGAAKPLYFAAAERGGAHAAEAHVAQIVPEGAVMVAAPLQGTIVTIQVKEGEVVRPGQQLAVIESMKMEHLVMAEQGGRVMKLAAERRRHADAWRADPVSRAARRRRGCVGCRNRCRSRPHPS